MYNFELHHTNRNTNLNTFCKVEHLDHTYILATIEEAKRAKRRHLFRRIVEALRKERAHEDEEYSYQSTRIPTM